MRIEVKLDDGTFNYHYRCYFTHGESRVVLVDKVTQDIEAVYPYTHLVYIREMAE